MTVKLPAWFQNGAYSAEVDRSVPTGLLAPSSPTGGRGGVRRWAGDEFQVTATSPASLSVVVKPGIAWVNGAYTSLQGAYAVVNDSDVTITVSTPSASNPRIDRVILEVLDSSYTGTTDLAQLRVVAGTPDPAPVAPPVGGSHIVLAELLVPQSGSSISSTSVVDRRQYAVANGGILPVRDPDARLTLTGVPTGTPVLEISTRRVYTYGGPQIGWEYVFGGNPPMVAVTPAAGFYHYSTVSGLANYDDLRVTKANGQVRAFGVLANKFSFSNQQEMFRFPVGYRPERRKLLRIPTGSGANRVAEVFTDGRVMTWPGIDSQSARANDWWVIDIGFFVNNHTVG